MFSSHNTPFSHSLMCDEGVFCDEEVLGDKSKYDSIAVPVETCFLIAPLVLYLFC